MQRPEMKDFYYIQDATPDEDGAIEAVLIPMRDLVLYPGMIAPLAVARDRSLQGIGVAQAANRTVIGVAQRDPELYEPQAKDLFDVGTEIAVGKMMRMPDGTMTALAQGRRRVHILSVKLENGYWKARARIMEVKPGKTREMQALMRTVNNLFEKCVNLSHTLPEEAAIFAMNAQDPSWLADLIAGTLQLPLEDKQGLLALADPAARLRQLSRFLTREIEVLEIEDQINQQVQIEMERGQREMFLREQMRAIQQELGEGDPYQEEIEELRLRAFECGMPPEVLEKTMREIDRLLAMPQIAPEVGIIRTYVDWLVELPWANASTDNLSIEHAVRVLEEDHFGLPKAKDRIVEYIAVRKLAAQKMKSPILCFVGPPGTGKTSLGKSVARALGREFLRVSLGGVRDEAEIRGHRRTYIGALPGRILQTMRRGKTVNPVFVLDEIDKVGHDFRGDPASALLEVLDPEQNNAFMDHYLDLPYDLSKVLFITTANTLEPLPSALLDRLEVIEFSGYTELEKIQIARRYLLPRQLEQNGLKKANPAFPDETLQYIIRAYTYEAGVRNLDREVASIMRKVARAVAAKEKYSKNISTEQVEVYLGPPRYLDSRLEESDQVGMVTGVSWTENGGDLSPVEITLIAGKGNVTLTGQLGDVLQESAQAALTYVRSQAKVLGIKEDTFDKTDIHLHMPEAAIPKDGPSAGVTIATALISAFTGRKVRRDMAMTGEITLRGRSLPVGGIKEKVMAAQRAGVKTVLLPSRNKKDEVDIPKSVLAEIQIIYVESMEDILKLALAPAEAKAGEAKKARGGKKPPAVKKPAPKEKPRRGKSLPKTPPNP
jgi:ATP-dependent Lon protease